MVPFSIFLANATNYYATFTYVIKIDKQIVISSRHPNVKEIGSPKTKKCVKEFREKSKKKKKKSKVENEFKPNDKKKK